MTSLTMHRLWNAPTLRFGTISRHLVVWADVINAAAVVARPLVVSMGVITAASTWSVPPPTHPEPLGDSVTNALNPANTSAVSLAVAAVGRPMLVGLPGPLASLASEMGCNTGLPPAHWVVMTNMVIQVHCPAITTSFAEGNVPFPLQLLGDSIERTPLPPTGTGPVPLAPSAAPPLSSS